MAGSMKSNLYPKGSSGEAPILGEKRGPGLKQIRRPGIALRESVQHGRGKNEGSLGQERQLRRLPTVKAAG
eukprot:11161132-Lingulodinium_polyedra.AAC.1